MKKIYNTPGLMVRDIMTESVFLVVSDGQVPATSFEGAWDTGEELNF